MHWPKSCSARFATGLLLMLNHRAWRGSADDGLPPGLQEAMRRDQADWACESVRARVQLLKRFRHALSAHAGRFAELCGEVRSVPAGEVFSSELLPLADACRFLETQAPRLLAPRRLGWQGRPPWLWGVQSRIYREPFGLVLILAPSNYPLYLAGVQALQALTAGNAVLLKPAPGCAAPLDLFARLLGEAGFAKSLCKMLPPGPEPVERWIRGAADLVILTGGAEAGRAVARVCSEALVPCILELSGLDSCHILAGADTDRAVQALLFGMLLNRGRTCIAPRRILVQREAAPGLRETLARATLRGPHLTLPARAAALVQEALAAGAKPRCGQWHPELGAITPPLILEGVPPDSGLWTEDHFSPVALLAEVGSVDEAAGLDRDCPYALGASIFTRDLPNATKLARQLPAPVVTVNDTVAPTADPRLPFGGCRHSGWGATRGAEGLLALTRPRAVACRAPASWAPHLEPAFPDRDRWLFQALHAPSWRSRAQAFLHLLAGRRARPESRRSPLP